MQNNQTGSTRSGNGSELRAAVDVMFEALSHIQASINVAEPEEREKHYRMFKEALYERFDHLLEQRRATDASATGEASADERVDRPLRQAVGDQGIDSEFLGVIESPVSSSTSGTGESSGDTENASASPTREDEEAADQGRTARTLWPISEER